MHTPATQSNWNGAENRRHSPARPDNKRTNSDPPGHGLRSQLQNLLPRHALFHARVQVHQLSSVPLVHGEFAARWKFKNVQSQTGLFKRAKKKRRGTHEDEKGKGREIDDADSFGSGDPPIDRSSSSNSIPEELNPNIPSVVISGYTSAMAAQPKSPFLNSSLHPDFSRTNSSAQSYSSTNSHSSSSGHLAPSLNLSSIASVSSPTPSTPSTSVENYSTARGITPFYKLKDHAVVWEHNLDVVVKMDVDRETAELLPSEFKIVIMQRVISGDPDAPKNPRLGTLSLDLSEYAGVGKEVTRSYLLRDTKMNATLKLTIYLQHVGGDTNYIAPPLPKGEILNGLTDLLEDDVYLTRPRALDLWGPYHNQQELEMDLLGGTSIPELQSAAAGKSRSKSRTRARSRARSSTRARSKSHTRPPTRQRHHTRMPSNGKSSMYSAEPEDSDADMGPDSEDDDNSDTGGGPQARYEVPFDVSRLPLAYGPKTTEMLIEALFNPVRVTDHNLQNSNPFTYYVSPEEVREEEEARKARQEDRDETLRAREFSGRRTPHSESVHSTEDNTSSSGHTGPHSLFQEDSNGDHRGRRTGVKGWWSRKKLGSTPTGSSRPRTPVAVQ